jgi:hypothetical protein
LIFALGIPASTVSARKPCSFKSCKPSIKARCAGLKAKAKRKCKKGIIAACKAGECSCLDGVPSCADPPTTTSTSTSTTTSTSSSTSSTTLVSGACLTDIGDGTIHDSCTGLQWEKKTIAAGLQSVGALYSWAGCCNGDCSSVANLCQPNAAAAATCAAQADGGTDGCSTCASGTCNVDPDADGVVTTVWDWINQVNAANFAGHDDWRLPSEAGNNTVSAAKELETIVDPTATGCGLGSPCIDGIFGPTAADAYSSGTTITSSTGMMWVVDFSAGNVGSGSKQNGFYARAVR